MPVKFTATVVQTAEVGKVDSLEDARLQYQNALENGLNLKDTDTVSVTAEEVK